VGDGISEYQRAITSLFARTGTSAKLGLERTRALLDQLGSPHLAYPTFHVAGTNGKGSVVAMLDALLRSKGLRVGRYTSPHLIDFRERIVVNGEQIAEQEVLDFLRRWEPEGERLGATFFEVTSVLAFEHFARERVDVAVIETGMGGRLDATNVITPVATAVTSVAMDHMEFLGESIEAIAQEKAGIFKEGVPAVVGPLSDCVREVMTSCAAAVGAPLVEAGKLFAVRNHEVTADGTRVELEHDGQVERVRIGLVGGVQGANASVALALLHAAGRQWRVGLDDARRPLAAVRLPGRFQRIGNVIVDVAHNVEGFRALRDTLDAVRLPRPLVAIIGILADKPWQEMIELIAPVVDRVLLTSPASAPADRRLNVRSAAALLGEHGVLHTASVAAALASARTDAAAILVCGSFFTAGEALALLRPIPSS
jgi:dihydrofolate synthase / folylpolyglutamate synthase